MHLEDQPASVVVREVGNDGLEFVERACRGVDNQDEE